jgi:hypothetical protein
LKFRTYEEATAFYDWLMLYFSKNGNQKKEIKIGGQTLKFKDSDLTYQQIKGDSRFRVMPYY